MRSRIIEQMKSCDQAPGYSVYQHGVDVSIFYQNLLRWLETGEGIFDMKDDIRYILKRLVPLQQPLSTMTEYHIFHDCGKPACLEIGEDGRRHFPGHSSKSYETFRTFSTNEIAAQLILHDMDCHMAKTAEQRKAIVENPLGPSMLLTAYAELYANATLLFGGYNSDSFKMKRKILDKIAKSFETML